MSSFVVIPMQSEKAIDKCIIDDTIMRAEGLPPRWEESIMTKVARQSKNDALGLIALGSVIVHLAQGNAYADLHKAHQDLYGAHQKLLALYQGLVQRYNQMWREYELLRSTNQELQRQSREYQRIVDKLNGEVNALQLRLAQNEGSK